VLAVLFEHPVIAGAAAASAIDKASRRDNLMGESSIRLLGAVSLAAQRFVREGTASLISPGQSGGPGRGEPAPGGDPRGEGVAGLVGHPPPSPAELGRVATRVPWCHEEARVYHRHKATGEFPL
jgi:hypothetical protein